MEACLSHGKYQRMPIAVELRVSFTDTDVVVTKILDLLIAGHPLACVKKVG